MKILDEKLMEENDLKEDKENQMEHIKNNFYDTMWDEKKNYKAYNNFLTGFNNSKEKFSKKNYRGISK